MSLLKHHGRRLAAVGVGVGLLVLGLEAPAFAAAPTVTAFTPTSGPISCVVDITGTGFSLSPAGSTTVNFVNPSNVATPVPGADVAIISDTEIWASVPAALTGTEGTDYAIRVDNLQGTGTASTTTFLLTSGDGACAPTVTSFAPTCGSAGDVVTITGTNLLNGDLSGGTVTFSPYTATEVASNTSPDQSSLTSLVVIVPDTAASGPLEVATDVDFLFTDTSFQVPPPDCPVVTPHARSITLKLRRHLVAKGHVSVGDGFTACAASVPVRIQRRVSGHWKTVGKTTTTATGAYKKKIRNRAGKYRSLAPKITLSTGDICSKAHSRTVTHR